MEHARHIWRAILILIVLVVGFVTAQYFMVPKSFGKMGHYRYDSLSEYMEKPVVHGDKLSCKKCHAAAYEDRDKGKHAAVHCEDCHAPLATHVSDGAKIADMAINRSFKLCAYCHQKLDARPKSFPQIAIRDHLVDQGMDPQQKLPEKICLNCHPPHSPSTK